jgi:hypothetical protein
MVRQFPLGLLVRNALIRFDLSLRYLNVLKELDLVQQVFILSHIQKHRRALPVMGDQERPVIFPDLPDKTGDMRAEFGQGTNVFLQG